MTSGAHALFTTPATAESLRRARAVVVLVGSYDGSGNYGDIAQLDAALDLVGRLGPSLLALPVLERAHLPSHVALAAESLHPPAHALFFGAADGSDDGLVPAPAPAELAFAACYLYGGGYLNAWWGERKLAMLRVAEALLAAGSPLQICRVASGLQVDTEWLTQLEHDDVGLLRSFEFLGARDPLSVAGLRSLATNGSVSETGDDAIAVLLRHARIPAAPASIDGQLHVNLHLVEHEWVSARPDALLEFYVEMVDELARIADLPIVAHPLIVYEDERITERSAVARLSSMCSTRGIKVDAPLVVRPASLGHDLAELGQASLTVSCSYHLALTSLFLGIPTLVVRDNGYYEQKAAGLVEAFDLPPTLTATANGNPRSTARALADIVLDDEGRHDLHRRLVKGARKLERRRVEGEFELLTRLTTASTTAMTARIDDLVERLRERSGQPAELLAQLSQLRTDYDALLRAARTPAVPLDAQQVLEEHRAKLAAERESAAAEAAARRAAEQQADLAERRLADVIGSKSWTLTAPLRRGAARLRRKHR